MAHERRVRILHVITRMIVGGAQENTLFTAALQTRNARYDVTLLTGLDDGPEGDLHDVTRSHGVRLEIEPFLVRPIRPLVDVRAFLNLRRRMRNGRYDIIHTHSSKAGILGRMAARSAGVPIVVHTLHSLVFHEYEKAWKNSLYVALKKVCAPWTDSFISVNQKTMDGALAHGIGAPEKHVKIFSGMDLAPFLNVSKDLSPSQAKRLAGLPEHALIVGKVARLFPLKGHDLFMDMAAKVVAARPEVHFLLVGGGILRETLEARARELGILDRVHFAGLVRSEQVPALIQAMDVVVHSSLREGIARVIPQAGAVGKPVVTFALDGAPEVIQDGLSGYLVSPRDTTAMAQRVVDLLASETERSRMGLEGQKFSRENYSAEMMVDRINAVYERLIKAKGLEPRLP